MRRRPAPAACIRHPPEPEEIACGIPRQCPPPPTAARGEPPRPGWRAPAGTVCAAAVLGSSTCWHRMHDPGHLAYLAALAALMLAASLVLVTGAACTCRARHGGIRWPARRLAAASSRSRPGSAGRCWLRTGTLVRCTAGAGRGPPGRPRLAVSASGGLTALFNLAVLCRAHNRVKSNYWRDPDGYVHYRPFAGAADMAGAASILRAECRRRRSPLRWLRSRAAQAPFAC